MNTKNVSTLNMAIDRAVPAQMVGDERSRMWMVGSRQPGASMAGQRKNRAVGGMWVCADFSKARAGLRPKLRATEDRSSLRRSNAVLPMSTARPLRAGPLGLVLARSGHPASKERAVACAMNTADQCANCLRVFVIPINARSNEPRSRSAILTDCCRGCASIVMAKEQPPPTLAEMLRRIWANQKEEEAHAT